MRTGRTKTTSALKALLQNLHTVELLCRVNAANVTYQRWTLDLIDGVSYVSVCDIGDNVHHCILFI